MWLIWFDVILFSSPGWIRDRIFDRPAQRKISYAGGCPESPKPTLLSLVRGIVDDAKQLVLGQYELRKYQTLREIAKAKWWRSGPVSV